MPSGRGVGLLLIRSWVLGNEAHEKRNGVLLFILLCVKKIMMDLYFIEREVTNYKQSRGFKKFFEL